MLDQLSEGDTESYDELIDDLMDEEYLFRKGYPTVGRLAEMLYRRNIADPMDIINRLRDDIGARDKIMVLVSVNGVLCDRERPNQKLMDENGI